MKMRLETRIHPRHRPRFDLDSITKAVLIIGGFVTHAQIEDSELLKSMSVAAATPPPRSPTCKCAIAAPSAAVSLTPIPPEIGPRPLCSRCGDQIVGPAGNVGSSATIFFSDC